MNILFLGDIVGEPGRRAVAQLLPLLVQEHGVALVIANGENAAGGIGLTPPIADELFDRGIDVLTSGNHIWKKKEIYPSLDQEARLLRPANYPEGTPGKGSAVVTGSNGTNIAVLNLEGRVFMKPLPSPFHQAEKDVARLNQNAKIIIVDIHAEATSEKVALGWFLDGKVSAVIGTHTHVQTSDERILPGGTAYITDVGMTGPRDSVIGMKKDSAIKSFLTMLPHKFEVARRNIEVQGVVVNVDELTGKACDIHRIAIPLEGR